MAMLEGKDIPELFDDELVRQINSEFQPETSKNQLRLPITQIYLLFPCHPNLFHCCSLPSDYILSTSCSGYWDVCGGVPPLVEDDYGFLYGIEDYRISFCCTAYRTCQTVDVREFYSNLSKTLL